MLSLSSKRLAFIALLLLPVSFLFSQGVTVQPTRLFFTGDPGSVTTQTVTITNNTNAPVAFSVGLSDWLRDTSGQKVYYPSGTLSRSNATWISFTEKSVSVAPGASKQVPVTLRVPQSLKSDSTTNSMLMFTQLAVQDDKYIKDNNIGIRVLFEFALHVFYTPSGNTREELDFTSIDTVSLKVDDTGKLQKFVAVKIKNTGNVNTDSSVEFELINNTTGDEVKLEPMPISMMPGAEQVVNFPIPETLKGNYKGVSILRVGSVSNVRVGEKDLKL